MSVSKIATKKKKTEVPSIEQLTAVNEVKVLEKLLKEPLLLEEAIKVVIVLKKYLDLDEDGLDELLDEVMFKGQKPPQEFRRIIAQMPNVTLRILIQFWGVMIYRGQRISAYAKKTEGSAATLTQIIQILSLRVYNGGKAGTGLTVGRVMACFPEIGSIISIKRGNSSLDEVPYRGELPIVYQHPAGYSILPFHLLDQEERVGLENAFFHWQNWYINSRQFLASSRNPNGKKIDQEKIMKAREKQRIFLKLQRDNPWPNSVCEAIMAAGSVDVKELKLISKFPYNGVTDSPPAAEQWIRVYCAEKNIPYPFKSGETEPKRRDTRYSREPKRKKEESSSEEDESEEEPKEKSKPSESRQPETPKPEAGKDKPPIEKKEKGGKSRKDTESKAAAAAIKKDKS